ncbi:MAG: S26 family signal peptidase [Akkermansiaceae bacterium]
MFAPKWKKEAKLLEKAAKKFLNYKRDLLKEDQIAEINSRISDLRQTVKSGTKVDCDEASKQLQATCENSLPRKHAQPGWLEENLEVIFVAVAVALGVRAYIIQPFRIPTGSMQPTLNGIVGHQLAPDKEFPNFAVQQIQRATHGRSYVNLVLKEDKRLRSKEPIQQSQFLHFFTRTSINFDDGTKMTFPGSSSALLDDFDFKQTANQARFNNAGVLPKGTIIARGYIDTGDLILVDKFSYHFRKPTRGEVFVFDTRGIKKIHQNARSRGEAAGSHYIKRLAGVPGDELSLRDISLVEPSFLNSYGVPAKNGKLFINGELAQEPGFTKVMSEKNGYIGYANYERFERDPNLFKARKSKLPGMNEYIALGDNSFHSSDSRDWGTVKEFNVIGPASFALWPFMSGHWGFIK